MKLNPFVPLTRCAVLALAVLAVSCEKKPETRPEPVRSTSATPEAPPGEDPQVAAARNLFDARAADILRQLREGHDRTLAMLTKAQGSQKGLKRHNDELKKRAGEEFRNYETRFATERAEWEAKKWAGYPMEKRDPAKKEIPATAEDEDPLEEARLHARVAPHGLSAAGTAAYEDFWKRRDAIIKAQMDDVERQIELLKAKNEESRASGTADRDTLKQMMEKVRAEQNEQMKTMDALRAARNELDDWAIAWNAKKWEGYVIPADPGAPPPKP